MRCLMYSMSKDILSILDKDVLIATNVLIILIFTSIAVSDLRTLLNIAMPFSVKAYDRYFKC